MCVLHSNAKNTLGDVRYVDVFSLASMSDVEQTCNGINMACFSFDGETLGADTMFGSAITVQHPSITTYDNKPAVLGRAVALMTIEADMPSYLEATPETCPCSKRSYEDSDLTDLDDSAAWLYDDNMVT